MDRVHRGVVSYTSRNLHLIEGESVVTGAVAS
jgi:hypothetical protein